MIVLRARNSTPLLLHACMQNRCHYSLLPCELKCLICVFGIKEQQHGGAKRQFVLREAPAQFSFDVSDHLDEVGNNELLLGVYDPTNNADGVPLGKQRSHSGHRQQVGTTNIVYTSSSGIWQTVSPLMRPGSAPWQLCKSYNFSSGGALSVKQFN